MEAKNTLEYKMFFISFMFLNSKLRELKIPVSQCIKSLINGDINPKLSRGVNMIRIDFYDDISDI